MGSIGGFVHRPSRCTKCQHTHWGRALMADGTPSGLTERAAGALAMAVTGGLSLVGTAAGRRRTSVRNGVSRAIGEPERPARGVPSTDRLRRGRRRSFACRSGAMAHATAHRPVARSAPVRQSSVRWARRPRFGPVSLLPFGFLRRDAHAAVTCSTFPLARDERLQGRRDDEPPVEELDRGQSVLGRALPHAGASQTCLLAGSRD